MDAITNDIGGWGNVYRFGKGEIREISQSASNENLNRVADVAQRNFLFGGCCKTARKHEGQARFPGSFNVALILRPRLPIQPNYSNEI